MIPQETSVTVKQPSHYNNFIMEKLSAEPLKQRSLVNL